MITTLPSSATPRRSPRAKLGLLALAACAVLVPAKLSAAEAATPLRPGKFVWADVFTSDPVQLERFYCRLFNWKAKTVDLGGGPYVVMSSGGRPVAGVTRHPSGKTGARWVGYISTENTGRATERMRNQGGRVLLGPREVPGRGNQAIVSDPEGAVVGVVTSSRGDAPDFKAEPGQWVWAQLFAKDPAKAAEFYRQALGYDLHEDTRFPGRGGVVLASGGFARAGVGPMPKSHPDARPSWLGFVRISNMGEVLRRTKELGGKVIIPPRKDFRDGRVAIIGDPMGGAVGVVVTK